MNFDMIHRLRKMRRGSSPTAFKFRVPMEYGDMFIFGYTCDHICDHRDMGKGSCQNYSRGKKILKFSLVLRTSTPKSLLVLLQNHAGHSRKYNLTLYLFYLPFGHWMKIFACPDRNFTCPGLQDK